MAQLHYSAELVDSSIYKTEHPSVCLFILVFLMQLNKVDLLRIYKSILKGNSNSDIKLLYTLGFCVVKSIPAVGVQGFYKYISLQLQASPRV